MTSFVSTNTSSFRPFLFDAKEESKEGESWLLDLSTRAKLPSLEETYAELKRINVPDATFESVIDALEWHNTDARQKLFILAREDNNLGLAFKLLPPASDPIYERKFWVKKLLKWACKKGKVEIVGKIFKNERIALTYEDYESYFAYLKPIDERIKELFRLHFPEYVKKMDKFLLGHHNSINGELYAGSTSSSQFSHLRMLLGTLPNFFSSNLTPDEKRELENAFQNAADTHKMCHKDVDYEKVLDSIRSGALTILPAGFSNHAIALVFCNGYFTIVNRGKGAPFSFRGYETVKAYQIDSNAITKDIVEKIVQASSGNKEEALNLYYETLPSHLSPRLDKNPSQDDVCTQLEELKAKIQGSENCSFAQAKLSARIAKAMLAIKTIGGKKVLEKSAVQSAYAFSKDFSSHIRLSAMDRYLSHHPLGAKTADEGLLTSVYKKLKKRIKNLLPENLRRYSNFQKWFSYLEARSKSWF
ncbi:MAG TPA: hypothetical protein VLG76_03270 [Rhabdochlamydiaceae bacterium]|nr:hypothetical protein [Rhabdochlamydiaceae bacterium]